jgi:hypothetical protein
VAPGGNNQGTLVRAPLIPNPSEPYTARLEGCRPGATFSVIIDFAYPTPIPHWPNAAADFVLRAGTPGQTFALVDGMGLVGPATPGLVFGFDPNGTAPGGVFTLTGYTMPASPLGARFSMQTAYVDPTSPVGFRLTWARTEDL